MREMERNEGRVKEEKEGLQRRNEELLKIQHIGLLTLLPIAMGPLGL